MTNDDAFDTLKIMLEEDDDSARMLSDERLELLLEDACGDVRRAAYQGALLKARCTGATLPDGVTLESNRQYWLTVARVYRGNYTALAKIAQKEREA